MQSLAEASAIRTKTARDPCIGHAQSLFSRVFRLPTKLIPNPNCRHVGSCDGAYFAFLLVMDRVAMASAAWINRSVSSPDPSALGPDVRREMLS